MVIHGSTWCGPWPMGSSYQVKAMVGPRPPPMDEPMATAAPRHNVCVKQILLLVVSCVLACVSAVDMPVASLTGGPPNENYIQLQHPPDTRYTYTLACSFRAGYDDQVISVTWRRYGQDVYTWTAGTNSVIVYPPLRGHVSLPAPNTTPEDDPPPHYVQFTTPTLGMAGEYTCNVLSSKMGEVTSPVVDVYIVDVASNNYETHVNVLSTIINGAGDGGEDGNNATTTRAPQPEPINPTTEDMWHHPEPEQPDPSCVLVWGFRTPAISPQPNITCGYYSYNHDDIVQSVPAGLMLHQLANGSWVAEIDDTKIPVASVPLQGRLGCSVTVPHTTYRKLIKFEDGLTVDSLIDSVGCPGFPATTQDYGLSVTVSGATTTCRGDHLPDSRHEPAVATVSCPSTAIFTDGHTDTMWSLTLRCFHDEMAWRSHDTPQANSDQQRIESGTGTDESTDAEDRDVMDMAGMGGMEAVDRMMGGGGSRMFGGKVVDVDRYQWPICVGSRSGAARTLKGELVSVLLMAMLLIWR